MFSNVIFITLKTFENLFQFRQNYPTKNLADNQVPNLSRDFDSV